MVYKLPSIFPTSHHANIGVYIVGMGSDKPFSSFMTAAMPDLAFWGSSNGQFFPRWTYQESDDEGALDFSESDDVDQWGYRRVDNITDAILTLYKSAIGGEVTKDDIFYYVYGVLHDPDYRARFAPDLKKMLPHIPTPETAERFRAVADIGRKLADLHVNYDAAEPYLLDVQLKAGADPAYRETWRVDKMKWKSKVDRTAIVYNAGVTVTNIPDAAHDYMLGSRSALEWLIDRYQIKTDKASGIVNDPNDWCDEHDDPTYIVDLIKKVTTVSVSTVELVAQLAH
jgi:predicted helicase